MSAQPDMLRDHEYDGIQEFDNPTPSWWTYIFVGSCAFSLVYFVFFHMGAGWTVKESYQIAVVDDLRKQFAEIGQLKPDEPTLLKYMQDPKWLTVGQLVFKGNCINCHGAEANGSIGPNMTDDHYKNVKTLADIPMVVSAGAANGAMPAWKTRLHPNEIVLVSAYIATLRGKNLPGPRPAEGDLIPPWPVAPTSEAAPAAATSPNKGDGG
jgi:cytochrome c oxidase cbb3-type subunit 3